MKNGTTSLILAILAVSIVDGFHGRIVDYVKLGLLIVAVGLEIAVAVKRK